MRKTFLEENSKMIDSTFEDLAGKICIITGGTGIIGQSLAIGLAGCKVKTVILGRRKTAADTVADEISQKYSVESIGVAGDVTCKESLEKALGEIHTRLGEIDILINCAGGNAPSATTKIEVMKKENLTDLSLTFYGLDIDGFRQVFDLNLLGTILPSMVFTKDMLKKEKGVVLNISSMNSFKPLTKIPAYSGSKAAVNNFTEWLAVHLASMNIRVNAIAPGFFLTEQNRFLLTDEKTGALTARGNKIIARTPMGKFGETADLCGACNFLVSDMSRFVTGVILPVDGGFNAYSGV